MVRVIRDVLVTTLAIATAYGLGFMSGSVFIAKEVSDMKDRSDIRRGRYDIRRNREFEKEES